jgi:DNA-binding MarR family transcriptional regulator
MAMWVNCMRLVPDDGIPVRELIRRSQLSSKSMQGVLTRMSSWWGYLTIDTASDVEGLSSKVVRPTRAGRAAQGTWQPLDGLIEQRWCDRFGADQIARLRAALSDLVCQFDVVMPDYLPVGEARLERQGTRSDDRQPAADWSLSALLSKALLAFGVDYNDASDLAMGIYTAGQQSRLAISANIVRVLADPGVRVADLPERCGVAKMTIGNWLNSLVTHRYAIVGPDPVGSSYKVVRLTPQGHDARDAYQHWIKDVELRWQQRYSLETVRELHSSLEAIIGSPIAVPSALLDTIRPYSDGWRAQLRTPDTLPHYPVISPRGGFPDGS